MTYENQGEFEYHTQCIACGSSDARAVYSSVVPTASRVGTGLRSRMVYLVQQHALKVYVWDY